MLKKGCSTRIHDYISNRIIESIQKDDSSGKRRRDLILKKFFDKKNTLNKNKMLITFSSLLPTYLTAHKPFLNSHEESCNELYFL